MKAGRFWGGMSAVIFFVLLLPGASPGSDLQHQLTQQSMVEQVLKRGVLRVGFSTFVPWAMQDKQGNFIGLEIDVATRLAQDMGVKVEFVPTKWSGIIPALLTGKFDMIIGGMGVRPDRNLKVNFSIPYYYTGMSMVAHKELARGFTGIEDFNRPEVVLIARMGTTAATAAKKHMPKAELRLFDDEAQGLQELVNGRAHAYVSEEPLPAFEAIKHPDKLFVPVREPFAKGAVGFAVRKGDVDTLNFLDNWIRVVQDEGWFQERKSYWFETRDWVRLIE